MYIAHRPDCDVFFKRYPEIAELAELWMKSIFIVNASGLLRRYAVFWNIKQVLDDNVMGNMAEWGVYRGNSAAVLACYARIYTEGSCCLILSRDLTSAIWSASMNQRQTNLPTRRWITCVTSSGTKT